MPAARPPPVERAEEFAVRPFPERLPVFRTGDGVGVSLSSGFVDGFSDDVEESLPADTPSPSSTVAGSGLATLAPPWRVIFGMLSSSNSTGTLAWIPSAAAEPSSA